jgi:hypothetical protein
MRKPMNSNVTSGFVSMSDMFNDVWIFLSLCCLSVFHLESAAI